MKTVLTLWDAISGVGIYMSGLPVFINLRKPRSWTIENGHILLATQRMIFALQQCQPYHCYAYLRGISRFCFCKLMMRVCYVFLTNLLEHCSNWAIPGLQFCHGITSSVNVFGFACSLYCLRTPTHFCMLMQIAHWLCVPCIQVATNMLPIPPHSFAMQCITFKDVNALIINIINVRHWLEKCVN